MEGGQGGLLWRTGRPSWGGEWGGPGLVWTPHEDQRRGRWGREGDGARGWLSPSWVQYRELVHTGEKWAGRPSRKGGTLPYCGSWGGQECSGARRWGLQYFCEGGQCGLVPGNHPWIHPCAYEMKDNKNTMDPFVVRRTDAPGSLSLMLRSEQQEEEDCSGADTHEEICEKRNTSRRCQVKSRRKE